MTASIKTLVAATIAAFGTSDASVAKLAAALTPAQRKDAKKARAILLPAVAAHYGVAVTTGQRGDTLDKDHAKFETAKSMLLRLTQSVTTGKKGSAKAEIVALSRAQKQVAATLAEMEPSVVAAIVRAASEIRKAAK